jgi:hypothetical protein
MAMNLLQGMMYAKNVMLISYITSGQKGVIMRNLNDFGW